MALANVSLLCALLHQITMPGGVFKLTTISSLYYPHKFPTNNWVRRTLTTTTTTTTTTTAASGRGLTHLNSTTIGECWWRCRISPCAPLAHLKIPRPSSNSNTNNRTNHLKVVVVVRQQQQGFGGQRFLHSSNSSAFSEQKGQGYNSHYNNSSGVANHMGPTPSDHHDDDDGKKPPPPSSNSAKLLTLPTLLTIGRVAAVPLLVATFYIDSWWGPNATTGIFIVAAVTDWLDGYLARKMKQGTAFGAFLDPVADKLMVAASLVLLCTKPLEAGIFGQAPWLLTVPAIAIIGREITMSAVREWAASQDGKLSEAVAVNNLGKWKTAAQMTALTILLATRDSSLIGAEALVASGVVLLYISAWLSLYSLFVYMRKIWKVLLM